VAFLAVLTVLKYKVSILRGPAVSRQWPHPGDNSALVT
jgi:hypothetical protein